MSNIQLPEEVKKWVTDAPPLGLGKTIDSVVEVQTQPREGATISTVLFTDGQVHSYTEYTAKPAGVTSTPDNIAQG
jgi:hypothetical protein